MNLHVKGFTEENGRVRSSNSKKYLVLQKIYILLLDKYFYIGYLKPDHPYHSLILGIHRKESKESNRHSHFELIIESLKDRFEA